MHYADRVVAIIDNFAPYPASWFDISQEDVDFVIAVDSIGYPQQIASGSKRSTTGAGGISLGAAACVKDVMLARGRY
ncbi:citrate lyase alpha subunit [Bradyrhizobium elkanii]